MPLPIVVTCGVCGRHINATSDKFVELEMRAYISTEVQYDYVCSLQCAETFATRTVAKLWERSASAYHDRLTSKAL